MPLCAMSQDMSRLCAEDMQRLAGSRVTPTSGKFAVSSSWAFKPGPNNSAIAFTE